MGLRPPRLGRALQEEEPHAKGPRVGDKRDDKTKDPRMSRASAVRGTERQAGAEPKKTGSLSVEPGFKHRKKNLTQVFTVSP